MNAMNMTPHKASDPRIPSHVAALQTVSAGRLFEIAACMARDASALRVLRSRTARIRLRDYCDTRDEFVALRHFVFVAFGDRLEFLRDVPLMCDIWREIVDYAKQNQPRPCITRTCSSITWGATRYCAGCQSRMSRIHDGVV